MTPRTLVRNVVVCLIVGITAVAMSGAPGTDQVPTGRTSAVVDMLDRYLAGEYAPVNAQLQTADFDGLLESLEREGVAWTEAGGPEEQPRRALAAATFALEAAGWAEQVMDWKWVQRVDLRPPSGVTTIYAQSYKPEDAIWWKAPPLLIAWGCALLRSAPEPSEAERLWHLASVAVADRVGDYEFLIGSVWDARGNPGDEFEHLDHSKARFPDEPRFELAEAIAVEFRTWSIGARRTRNSARNLNDARDMFRNLVDRDAIGAEAMIRLGFVRHRARAYGDAIDWFERGERATRDPYLVYLATYFRGQALEADDEPDAAEQAYRDALRVIPRAQSATMALAAMLARTDRPLEASELVEASLMEPIVSDPWREYGAADNRFWPYLITRLHEEIQRGRLVLGAVR